MEMVDDMDDQAMVDCVLRQANYVPLTSSRRLTDEQHLKITPDTPHVIGRASETLGSCFAFRTNALFANDFIDRSHASLTMDSSAEPRERVLITDTNSVNGTFVNGKKLTSDEPSASLRSGDVVELGPSADEHQGEFNSENIIRSSWQTN